MYTYGCVDGLYKMTDCVCTCLHQPTESRQRHAGWKCKWLPPLGPINLTPEIYQSHICCELTFSCAHVTTRRRNCTDSQRRRHVPPKLGRSRATLIPSCALHGRLLLCPWTGLW